MPVGTVTDGKITRLTDFSAFVELEPGMRVWSMSQISERVEKPSDVLTEDRWSGKGHKPQAEPRRIGLSIKEVEEEIRPERPATTNRSKTKQEEPLGGATIGELVGDILKQHELAGQADADSGEAESVGEESEQSGDDAAESGTGKDE